MIKFKKKRIEHGIIYICICLILLTIVFISENIVISCSRSLAELNSYISKVNEIEAKVLRVIDGDTIEVEILDNNSKYNKKEKVRFIGVDTPETKHPKKKVQYFGKEASAYTQRMLENKKVILQFDNTTRDRYGRLLCYVFRKEDNILINYKLIYDGYGYAYTKFPFKYKKEFIKAEKSAQQRKVGLWGEK